MSVMNYYAIARKDVLGRLEFLSDYPAPHWNRAQKSRTSDRVTKTYKVNNADWTSKFSYYTERKEAVQACKLHGGAVYAVGIDPYDGDIELYVEEFKQS